MASIFSSPKNHSPRTEKSNNNRSLLEPENADSSLNSRSNSKFFAPITYPSSSSSTSNGFNFNVDSYLITTSSDLTKLSTDDIDHDNLQSSSKDDLIKFIIKLQRQH